VIAAKTRRKEFGLISMEFAKNSKNKQHSDFQN